MKTIAALIFLFISVHLEGQTNVSMLLPLDDASHGFIVRACAENDRIYVLSSRYSNVGGPYNNGYAELIVVGFDGLIQKTRLLDSSVYAYTTTYGKRTLLASNGYIWSTGIAWNSPYTKASQVWLFDSEGNALHHFDFNTNQEISKGNILITSDDPNQVYHLTLCTNNYNNSFLRIRLLDVQGNVLWNKSMLLPPGNYRDYDGIFSAVRTSDKLVVHCSFGDFQGGPGDAAIETDLQGENMQFHILYGNVYKRISTLCNIPGLDSFRLASYGYQNGNDYPCLFRFNNSTTNLEGSTYVNGDVAQWSIRPSDAVMDVQGNTYTAGGRSDSNNDLFRGWVAKWSAGGDLLWQKTYQYINSNDANASFSSIDLLDDGRLLLAGVVAESLQPGAQHYRWILVLDADGCYNGDCSDSLNIESFPVSIQESHETNHPSWVTIHPNPVAAWLHLELDAEVHGATTFRLFDVEGREVAVFSMHSGHNAVSFPPTLPPGQYYWVAYNSTQQQTQSGMLIKQ